MHIVEFILIILISVVVLAYGWGILEKLFRIIFESVIKPFFGSFLLIVIGVGGFFALIWAVKTVWYLV